MDLTQVRAFVAVAEELNFSRAAERLHMAQPPTSRAVQRLERELGATLFERTSRHVALTPVGEVLLPRARAILQGIDELAVVATQANRGFTGRVRLGYAGASTLRIVGQLARDVRREYPGIRLDLVSHQYALGVMDQLVNDELDIALGRWEGFPPGIGSRHLGTEDLVLAVADTHPLAQRRSVTIGDLDGETFVALPAEAESLTLSRLTSMAGQAGISYEVVQSAPDSWTLMSLVAAEVGLSVTVSSVIPMIADPHVRFVPIDDPQATIDLNVAWRDTGDAPAVTSVLSLLDGLGPEPGGLRKA